MKRIVAACLALAAAPALAQETFVCNGDAPGWTLTLGADTAAFHLAYATEMQVRHETAAEGRAWPRAFTLIGDRDTAILLIERAPCGDAPYRARVFTQRGQTPILLAGCCEAAP
ncbi:hypothetical protein P1J78_02135 [Psychromarinibacter sp. C21-152]|uniref:Uncharacterized protein n=1 Tax=Psychromarinibacter sediminicola TaxID=3033385 RepID=A0AAE3NPY3_9RHOB|nr:hypothetical protein [Psychromarinibacter sediminicola]MDF0599519.1 hypothetical protein [Psychromarinibacter sediminicola]